MLLTMSFSDVLEFVKTLRYCKQHYPSFFHIFQAQSFVDFVTVTVNQELLMTSKICDLDTINHLLNKNILFQNIQETFDFIQKSVSKEDLGLLDLDFICNCHQQLLKNLIPSQCTPAGQLSFCLRSASYKDKIHFYPHCKSYHEWFSQIQPVLDVYNSNFDRNIHQPLNLERLKALLRNAAWIFQRLITFHPFADGNGRMSRTILAYSCIPIFGFPVFLYALRTYDGHSDLIDALQKQDTDRILKFLVQSILLSRHLFGIRFKKWQKYISFGKSRTETGKN